MEEKARILMIRGEADSFSMSESVLERKDRSLLLARSGQDALEQLKSGDFRLLIFPFTMQDMSAPELCRQVRSDSLLQGISLLHVASGDQTEAELCMAAGSNDVLVVPFTPETLDATVRKLTSIPVRRSLRTLTRISLDVSTNGETITGHSLNISGSGMLLQVNRILPPAAEVGIAFYLGSDSRLIEVKGHIIRAEFSGGVPKYGVQFLPLSPENAEKISSFVEAQKVLPALRSAE